MYLLPLVICKKKKKNKDVILFSSALCKALIDVQGAT